MRRKAKKTIRTLLGWAGVSVSEQGIARVVLPKKDRRSVEKELELTMGSVRTAEKLPVSRGAVLAQSVRLLQKYFSGKRVLFDVPLDVRYYTPFQQAVWKEVMEIPYGETRTYAWIAKRIGKPMAARAVGQAVGANPIPIIIP